MRFAVLLILIGLLLPMPGQSQSDVKELTLLDSLGEYYFEAGELDSSLHYYHRLAPLAEQAQASFFQLEAYNWIFVLKVFTEATDSLPFYIDRMTPLALRLQAQTPEEHDILSSFWNYKSYFHDLRGEFFQKIEGDKNALRHYEQLPDPDSAELAVLYQNVGTALEETGDYFQANTYSRKALELLRPSESRSDLIRLDSLKIIISIGTQLSNMARYQEAAAFFQRGEQLAGHLGRSQQADEHETAALFHIQWGVNAYKLQEYSKSTTHLATAKSMLDRSEELSDAYPMLLRYMARNAIEQDQLAEAEKLARRAQQMLATHFPTHVYYRLEILELLGDVHRRTQQYSSALQHYQKAIQLLCPGFSAVDDIVNPALPQISHGKNELLGILSKKGEVLVALGQKEDALATYQLAIDLFQTTRGDFLTEDARIYLSGQMQPLFERATATAIALQNFEKAFHLVEQSKALVLHEALNEQEAYQLAAVPDSMMQQLQQLKVERAYWEKSLFEQRSTGDSSLLQRAGDQLFALKRKEELLQEQLHEAYPEFAALKFGKEVPGLTDLRHNLLQTGQALIEYFVGETQIFVFGITQNELQVQVIEKPISFVPSINQLLAILRQDEHADALGYGKTAYPVFEQYLAPILSALSSPVEELIIIPDGLFCYLPFEALLTEPAQRNAYSVLPYLVKSYSCSYAYSSALLLRSAAHPGRASGPFVGFAPEFSGSSAIAQRKDLGPLKYNIEAVNALQKITGGLSYTHEQASKANLLSRSTPPLILHLSTHAGMNDEYPMASKIYLANGEDISTQEIYNLPYSCGMVVLSACETGTGKYYKGEGMMSLARAFMQSGSPSVVTSLWKVDDRSTSELMVKFYSHLQEGLPKHLAMHRAQLDFMSEKESEMLHHPYYWAPFIHIGDTAPISFSNGWPSWVWVVGLLVILGLLFYFTRRHGGTARQS